MLKGLHARALLTVSLLASVPGWAQAAEPKAAAGAQITFHADEAYPESFAWSPRQKVFFVGSIHKGTLGTVSLTGTYKPFASDSAMVASTGIKYDAKRNLVWAALCDIGVATQSSPRTQGKQAAVIAFDASTGKKKHAIDLTGVGSDGAHCANDLAFDPAGNVYVTDSNTPVVYVIDRHFKPRELVRNEAFTGEGFNLNGIVYHPDGYLLVGKHNTGDLFRITLGPKVEVRAVQLSAKIPGADGIERVDRNTLVIAQNAGQDRAIRVTSTDGWQSAEVVEVARSVASFPVAVTTVGNDLYMLVNRVDTLIDPSAKKVSDYLVQRLPSKSGD
ncbi:hypothetical protein LMG6871_01340 [Ralstonia edaphis]|nr:hypothetical protein LMG6871_01340 [Ralstonia sp. LMG 6871]